MENCQDEIQICYDSFYDLTVEGENSQRILQCLRNFAEGHNRSHFNGHRSKELYHGSCGIGFHSEEALVLRSYFPRAANVGSNYFDLGLLDVFICEELFDYVEFVCRLWI